MTRIRRFSSLKSTATNCRSTPSRGRERSSIAGASRARSSLLALLLFVLLFLFVLVFFRRLLRLGCQGPVGLEHVAHLLDDPLIRNDDPDFSARVPFQLAQARTPEEGGAAVTDDRADVQTEVWQLAGF